MLNVCTLYVQNNSWLPYFFSSHLVILDIMKNVININTDAAVIFTNQLEKMSRSALPVAVRGTLNKAAFNTKKITMPEEAASSFEKRSPNFFKANSRVEMATGFNISSMKATIGFVSDNLKGQNNYAVENLEQQEHGGAIRKRAFIPMNQARAGNSHSKNVRPNARLSALKKIVNARDAKGVNSRQKFIKSAIYAGKGGLVLASSNGRTILWRVNSLKKTKGGKLKLTPLYTFRQNRSISVKKTSFMRKSSIKSAANLEKYFIAEAERQLKKL